MDPVRLKIQPENSLSTTKGNVKCFKSRQGKGDDSSPLLSPSGMLCPVLGCPVEERYETLEQVQRMSIKMVTGAYGIQAEAGKEGSGGKIINKYMQARSFSVVPSDEARGNG